MQNDFVAHKIQNSFLHLKGKITLVHQKIQNIFSAPKGQNNSSAL